MNETPSETRPCRGGTSEQLLRGSPAQLLVRDRLVATAREMLLEQGYQAPSLGAIAARAGVERGVAYSIFDDKLDLYLQIIGQVSNAVGDRITDEGRSEPSDPDVVLRTMAAGILAQVAQPGYNLVFAEFRSTLGRDEVALARYEAFQTERIAAIAERLVASLDRAGLEPVVEPREFGTIVAALINGLILEGVGVSVSTTLVSPEALTRVLRGIVRTRTPGR